MRKATVTYNAPVGDNRSVEMGGVSFADGETVEINTYDNPHLISKLQGNPYFNVDLGQEDDAPPPKAKRGRPSNADIAAAKEAADRAEKDASDANAKAEQAKSDHEKLSNAPDKEVTRPPAEGRRANLKAGIEEARDHDFEADRRANLANHEIMAGSRKPAQDEPASAE